MGGHSLEYDPAPRIGGTRPRRRLTCPVLDSQASNFTDGRSGIGDRQPMIRIDKPRDCLMLKLHVRGPWTDFLRLVSRLVWFPV